MALSILTPLYFAFGWILDQMYQFFGNYGFVILLFTFLIKLLVIPLSFKQNKMMLMQQALQPQIDDLKREYKDDKVAFSEAQMALFKKHNVSMTGGCLSSLISLAIIWPIYRIVCMPLQHISRVSSENLQAIAAYLYSNSLVPETVIKSLSQYDIAVNSALIKNPNVISYVVDQKWIKASDILNMNFFGFDLSVIPSIRPSDLFGENSAIYLPILLIPIFAVGTALLSGFVMEWTNPNYKKMKEAKELAKKNPARSEPTDTTQSTLKTMKYMMPLITVYTVFTAPAALGLYWIASNIMIIAQQYLIYYIYRKND